MNMNKKRLTLHSAEKSLENLGVRRREFSTAPRFDMTSGQNIGAIVMEDAQRVFKGFRWGITPFWWDDSHQGHNLHSARAESIANKPAFADSFKHRRAVVPVDGFWVYGDVDGISRPFLIRAKDESALYLAAIWQENNGESQLALVNVEANHLLEPFGKRMPAILRGDDVNIWLEPNIVSEKPLMGVLKTPPVRGLLVTATAPHGRGRYGLLPADDAREALALIYGQNFKPEKPKFATRRRMVIRDHEAGGHVFFRTKSFSRDDATRWHPVVDVECGHVFCDCPDFRYRHAHHEPDVWTPHWWCKHVRRAVDNCKRHGEIPDRSELVSQ